MTKIFILAYWIASINQTFFKLMHHKTIHTEISNHNTENNFLKAFVKEISLENITSNYLVKTTLDLETKQKKGSKKDLDFVAREKSMQKNIAIAQTDKKLIETLYPNSINIDAYDNSVISNYNIDSNTKDADKDTDKDTKKLNSKNTKNIKNQEIIKTILADISSQKSRKNIDKSKESTVEEDEETIIAFDDNELINDPTIRYVPQEMVQVKKKTRQNIVIQSVIKEGSKYFCIIGDNMCKEGDKVEDIKIKKITETGVIVTDDEGLDSILEF